MQRVALEIAPKSPVEQPRRNIEGEIAARGITGLGVTGSFDRPRIAIFVALDDNQHFDSIDEACALLERMSEVPRIGRIRYSVLFIEQPIGQPQATAERIVRLARLVGRENVIASTDCGFAQGPFARRVHPSIMWAKLQALVDGARIASRELWGK